MESKRNKLFTSNFVFFKRKVILSFCIASWEEQYYKEYPKDLSIPTMEPQFFVSSPDTKVSRDNWKARLQIAYTSAKVIVDDQPEFICTSLADGSNQRTYQYGIKFCELGQHMKKLPVCILLQSSQEDSEQFRLLLMYLYHFYIRDNVGTGKIANYKKIEILNILFFLFANLFIPSPHSTLSIKLPYLLEKYNIEFYFSSNFELPCHKFDNGIRKLFSYLDLSIIIKIVFKLLSEKTVILLSNDSSILNSMLPAIHSLIFPLVWIYLYLPVIPEKQTTSLLESPTQYFFGIAGNDKENVINMVKKEFVVDCDTNEIFSDKKFVDFCPLPSSEFLNGKPYLIIEKKHLRKIDLRTNETSDITFLKEGKVIIDCDDDNKLVTEHEDQYLSTEESVKLREKIQELKKGSFNRTNADLRNSNLNIVQENHCERSFDYKMKKIFTKLIIDKLKDNDLLFEDIKHSNSFYEYNSPSEFQNDSPKQIVKNVFQTEEGDRKRFFENSFKINIFVKSFEDNEQNRTLFDFNSKLFEDYLDIAHQLQSTPINSANSKSGTVNSSPRQINFYGEDGVINIAKKLNDKIKNMEQFIEEVYSSQVLLYALNENKDKNNNNNNKQYAISFESPKDLEESHQYYNYLGKLFYELSKTNLAIQVDDEGDRDDFLLNNIIANFKMGCSLKEDEFPFFVFHSILREVPKNKLQVICGMLSDSKKLETICEELINEKQKLEDDLKVKKEARDKRKKEREEKEKREKEEKEKKEKEEKSEKTKK